MKRKDRMINVYDKAIKYMPANHARIYSSIVTDIIDGVEFSDYAWRLKRELEEKYKYRYPTHPKMLRRWVR